MSPLSQKLSELRPFSWVKSWQNLKSIKFSNHKISLTVSRSNNNLEPSNWIRALCTLKHLTSNTSNASKRRNDYRHTHKQTDSVTLLLLELLIAAKNAASQLYRESTRGHQPPPNIFLTNQNRTNSNVETGTKETKVS